MHRHHLDRNLITDSHEAIARGILRRRKKETRDALFYHNERIRKQTFHMLEGMAGG